jgi:hypothetical protein
MSTVAEVKAAVEQLNPCERREVFRWLTARDDFQQQWLEDLRRDIRVGIEEADRGELAPLDIEAVKREARQCRATNGA